MCLDVLNGRCLEEGPKGGVCVRFYEENKAHLRFTKIIDSHLRFTKIIRKYICISWFSLRNTSYGGHSSMIMCDPGRWCAAPALYKWGGGE